MPEQNQDVPDLEELSAPISPGGGRQEKEEPVLLRPSRRPQIITALKYAGFTTAMLLLFLYVTFPFDRLGGLFDAELRKNKGWRMDVKEVSSHFFTGLDLRGLKISDLDARSPEVAPLILLDRATVWLNPLSWLFGNTAVSFSGKHKSGAFSGKVVLDGQKIAIQSVEIEKLLLDAFPITRSSLDLEQPIKGEIKGDVELTVDGGDFSELEGVIDLSGKNLVLEGLRVKTPMGPLSMPKLSFSKASVKILVVDSTIEVKEIQLTGLELSLGIKGEVLLKKDWRDSKLNLDLDIKLGSALASKFQIFLQNAPKKGEFYSLKIAGNAGAPRVPQLGL